MDVATAWRDTSGRDEAGASHGESRLERVR